MSDLDTLAKKLKALGAPGDYGYGTPAGEAIFLAHQIIAAAQVERDALIAATLERAAEAAYQWWDDDDAHELRDHIRALATHPQTDALAARDRAKVVEGMREAADRYHDEMRRGANVLAAEGYATFSNRVVQASSLVRDAILAAADAREPGHA